MRGVVVLGSTGSVGRQALDVVRTHPDLFRLVGIAAGANARVLMEQAAEFRPEVVCLAEPGDLEGATAGLPGCTRLATGDASILELAAHPSADIVVSAMAGFRGVAPTLAALKAGKRVAMACKEALVAAGAILLATAAESGAEVIPVDSEHSAIFQCLQGARTTPARLILTASGGPFRTSPAEALDHVRPSDALRHPNWRMGAKVTVDSATLMNKGLEVIEAHVLFSVPYDRIEVVVHPQSIIHSMVEMADGSVLAQMAVPDMRLPIRYAMTYPERVSDSWPRLDFSQVRRLDFEPPDRSRFPALDLGYAAGKIGGTMPAVLSAADEVAVQMFLCGAIRFTAIPRVVADVMEMHSTVPDPDLETVMWADRWARETAARVSART
ncbi:MAG: 1-deoxy-D-xylulose-5-phosphate reductoisomerase [Firmicutes bacterium]|nr:1-deoxy-D-xylulose-5-phosphate reductoisomerase [Bacillota bacterium]